MFQFLHPENLYYLLLIPVLIFIYILFYRKDKHNLSRLGDSDKLEALMPERSNRRKHIKFFILLLTFALLITTWARPQYGLKQQQNVTKGIEAVVMVDVSNSMLANDVKPTRLDRTKLLVSNLVNRIKNDKIALGVFAGEAYPQLPITSDYAAAQLFIEAMSTNMVTLQGTNLAAAIETARHCFTDNKNVGKAIILITDGENHEPGAEKAAEEASEAGINVFVLGVGSAEGSAIPTPYGVLTDRNGQVVHTKLNEQMCREVAKSGKGLYLHLDQTNHAQEELQNQISRLKQTTTTTSYTARDEQFQAVALIALLLLIIEVCINETKNPFFKRFKLF